MFKFGLDGSSGHPQFDQLLADLQSRVQGSCLASLMVPLQLITVVQNKVHLLYHNWWCNSPKSIRPLRLWFVKESDGLMGTTAAEIKRLNDELKELQTYNYQDLAKIDFTPLLTMIDNKVKNVLFGNRNQKKCPFCLCDMETAMHTDVNFASPESLDLMCLSILHFLIHVFGHICNLGYRWTVKEWNKHYNIP